MVFGDEETVQRTQRFVLVSGNAKGVPMNYENDNWEEEEEVFREAASEVEPFDSVTVNNEKEVAAIDVPVPRPGITRGALESLDEVDLRSLFTQRASLTINVPRCLVGPFRNALRVPLEEVSEEQGTQFKWRGDGNFFIAAQDVVASPPEVQVDRTIRQISPGRVGQLIHASVQCVEQAAVIRRRKGRRGDDLERRAIRALNFVQVGEFYSARQALEGAEVAPSTKDTLKKLSDTSTRPDKLRDPIPQNVM